ncbi:MAG: IS3 family transposase [Candidatus Delongbacteria bacterium]|nr:IS3 family transposase [Candidatus Delongbacteria bacterium]
MYILNDYLKWYNKKRIKMSLGAMSPVEYRKNLGLVV